jgi:hypothetical protein
MGLPLFTELPRRLVFSEVRVLQVGPLDAEGEARRRQETGAPRDPGTRSP